MTALTLQAGDWRLILAPERGGAILNLDWRGLPVLRATPPGATDMLQTACFPLVPYANRIADGRFAFDGRLVRLPALPRFAPHALHGDGWLRPWAVLSAQASQAELGLDWSGSGDADGWPWPWRARQTFALTPQGLDVVLTVTNIGVSSMPAGLGLHPYFPRAADTRLTLAAQGVWLTDAREIPTRLAPCDAVTDWTEGRAVADAPFVDHAYAGWTGRALIQGAGRRVTLSAGPNARWVQVYAPLNADVFCVEPVTHRPDGANAPAEEDSGLTRLAPGQTLSLTMRLTAEDA